VARLTSNPTAAEVAGVLLAGLTHETLSPDATVRLAQQVVRLIHEEREAGNLLAFKAGHEAGFNAVANCSDDVPVERKYGWWMESTSWPS